MIDENEILELFDGNVVIIDDEINSPTGALKELINELNDKSILFHKLDRIPDDWQINNFRNISFMILDWEFKPNDKDFKALQMSDDLKANPTINLIKDIREKYFFPIFIFSQDEKEEIICELKKAELFSEKIPNNILVEKKNEPFNLIENLKSWLCDNPALYVMKKWDKEYQKSKAQLFKSLSSISCFWPNILWKCYKKDGVNPSEELSELISRNLSSRINYFEYDKEILCNKKNDNINILKQVIENSKFIKKEYINTNTFSTGDLYKKSICEDEFDYYINIRPLCDIKKKKSELYLIGGKTVDLSNLKDEQNELLKKYGCFNEKVCEVFLDLVDDGKVIQFCFNQLKIVSKDKIDENNLVYIGRLLSPYIDKIQQKFAFYLQRKGLPRTPCEVYVNPNSETKPNLVSANTNATDSNLNKERSLQN